MGATNMLVDKAVPRPALQAAVLHHLGLKHITDWELERVLEKMQPEKLHALVAEHADFLKKSTRDECAKIRIRTKRTKCR